MDRPFVADTGNRVIGVAGGLLIAAAPLTAVAAVLAYQGRATAMPPSVTL